MGSTWGNHLKISIFGESHGEGIGVVIDGFPAGIAVDMDAVKRDMARRAPGQNKLTTARIEGDIPVILSGILKGKTTGAPICAMIKNLDQHSGDYENLRVSPRPSHSDLTGAQRYKGENDIRGGGHFSGRLTAPLVFAGAVCKGFLKSKKNIAVGSHLYSVGKVKDVPFCLSTLTKERLEALQTQKIPVQSKEAKEKMLGLIDEARMGCDSVGGVIECGVVGIEAGIGSPMFESVESRMASILYGIPGVKGVEFGMGFEIAQKMGSEVNDCYAIEEDEIITTTNNNGGILGGITTGMPLVLRVAMKPTASIATPQNTLNRTTGMVEPLVIKGRHDPCIALRAAVVVEAAVAIALLDLYVEAKGYDAQ